MSVSDTGCGIKKSELGSIFNRYERVVGNQGSNGLGLAIVDSLVGLMNGKVDVDSVYGKGSVFTVTIDQKVIQSDSVTSSSNQNGRVNIFDAKGMRVLVVDDNKLNLKVACKLLSVYNVDVVEAMSGQEFLDIIDADRDFDLILMDDMMPKMSGTETLNIFKKIERVDGFDIPVVVLTANAISGMRDKYLKSGFDDYLAKPIDKYELNRVLKKYLKVNKNTRNIDNNDNNNVSSGSNRVRGHKINKRDYE
jgi:CheY-like chemotaxis protein